MSVVYALVAASLFGCGLYMVLSRAVVRLVLGLSLVATAVNLMIFQAGRIRSEQPPIIPAGAKQLGESADPVPQALILTAIVIGFALTVMFAALALRSYRDRGTLVNEGAGPAEQLGDPFTGSVGDDR
ncbi:MAG TPA: sodium:proton antiporter [Gemmatimonadaceae bacterium]|jgi:multicomponent Na+:H+ antiporter subunit C|nr:sodium:proton antiporter [Gemmatimonadaceae bacterium]